MKRLLGLAVAVAAVSLSAEELPMEHVLVSVPLHKKEAQTALPVTVLTGDELRRQAATSIGETLGDKPGIANSSFGPGVGRPVIRGQQGPRAITLQNGTLAADASSLSPDHGVTVEPLLANSIEVLRGPATLLYGGGAIGGVVNVIDDRIPRARLDGVEGAVEYRYDRASDMNSGVFRLDAGNGDLMLHLDGTTRDSDDLEIPGEAIDEQAVEEQEEPPGGHEEGEEDIENTDGYIANTDTDIDVLTGGISYHIGEVGYTGLAVSHLESEYGIPPGAHGHENEEGHDHESEPDDAHEEEAEGFVRIDMEMTRYDAILHLHEPLDGIEVARGFLTHTDYQHKELEGSETGTKFDRDTWESRLELEHDEFLGAHGVLGLQLRADEFSAVGDEAYIPETDSVETGLFLIEDYHVNDWTWEAGLRVDYVERDPDAVNASTEDFTSFSVSGSALWQFTETWQAGLSLSRASRAPSTEELYSNVDADNPDELVVHAATGIIEIGDPDLDQEVSLNGDLNLQWISGQSWVELSLFYNRFDDYIFLLNTGEEVDETPVYDYAQDDADFYGVELESSFHLADLGPGALALGINGDTITGKFDNNGDVPRMPPARIGGKLSWDGKDFSTWVRVLRSADQDNPGEFETETDGYTRWDVGADYTFRFADERELLVFLKWKNVGDEEIRLSTSFLRNDAPEPGQSFSLGIRASF